MHFWKLLLGLLVILSFTGSGPVLAQGGDTDSCPAIVTAALDLTTNACEDLDRNQACYGHVVLTATPRPDIPVFAFVDSGDRVDVNHLERLRLGPMSPLDRTWGVAMLRIQANLPDLLPGQAVTMVLFGAVEVTNAVDNMPRLPVTALRGVNVRQLPDTGGTIITSLLAGDVVEANGQSGEGWLRVRLPDERIGWVAADLVSSEQDLTELVTITNYDDVPSRFTPMQAFYLNTGFNAPACAEAPADGLLIQTPEDAVETVALVINDTAIQLGSTVFVQAAQDDIMIIRTVEGYALVTAAGETQLVPGGTQVSVPLEGLSASGPPGEPAPYLDDAVRALPVTTLERAVTIADPVQEDAITEAALAALPCVLVAVSDTTQYYGPGQAFSASDFLLQQGRTRDPRAYAVGQDGFIWWRVTRGLWVREDTVEVAASCRYLPVEEAAMPAAPTPIPILDLSTISTSAACLAAPYGAANMRSGPGTNYGMAGQLAGGQQVTPTGYSQGVDGYRWWQLAEGGWVRGDLVQTAAACLSLGEVTSTPEPPAQVSAGGTGRRQQGSCENFAYNVLDAINVFACQFAGGYDIEAGCSYPIRMGAGFPNGDETEARSMINNFRFSTSLNGVGLPAVSGNVAEYNSYVGNWEVNQYYSTPVLGPGSYTLVGNSSLNGRAIDSATCTLRVRVFD